MRRIAVAGIVLIASVAGSSFSSAQTADNAPVEWPVYGGDAGGSRYSPLTEINKGNVARLKVAWELHTGDVSDGSDGRPKSEFEATPIVADGTMFVTTPFNRVLALDPETGQEKWRFDPKLDLHVRYSEGLVNRGVTFWSAPGDVQTGHMPSADFPRHDRCPAVCAGRCDRQSLRRFRQRRDRSTSSRASPTSPAPANMKRLPRPR